MFTRRAIQSRRLRGNIFQKLLPACFSFLYKFAFFYQGDGYLWPHCYMNIIYISHRSLYAPTYSFWTIGRMLISLIRVTSWFDTVCNIVARWVNFILLQYLKIFWPKYIYISGIIYNISFWPWKVHKQKLWIYIFLPEFFTIWEKILQNIVVG